MRGKRDNFFVQRPSMKLVRCILNQEEIAGFMHYVDGKEIRTSYSTRIGWVNEIMLILQYLP